MEKTDSGPGAPLPPTLIYLAGFLCGWWLDGRMPLWPGWEPPLVIEIVGWGKTIAGVGLFLWGLSTFARLRTGIMLQRAATRVVDLAPYSWSRNPQYVAFSLIYVGAAFAAGLWWPLLLLPFVVRLLTVAVISREERYMRSMFGDAYDDYCRRVPRWI